MALFFHLRYDYDPTAAEPTAVDEALAARLPLDPPTDSGYSYETVATLWEQLSDEQRATLAEFVWQHLPETNRDANRHAADHAAVKHRLDAALSTNADRDTVLARLAETEHRRWCAEKFLGGWEPLPLEQQTAWKTDTEAEARFREQRYHLDLRPMDELEAITDGEGEKDLTLVRFVLEHARLARGHR
jgi:DNA primase